MSRPRIVSVAAAAVVGALALGLFGGSAAAGGCAVVIAHRGASAVSPENTIPAIGKAAAAGADRSEVDVRRTSDSRWVLMHDATLSRTTDAEKRFPAAGPWAVAANPYSSIRVLDAGTWKNGRYAAVPTAGQAVPLNIPLLLEPKVRLSTDRVARLVEGHDVIVQTFDVGYARLLKAREPGLTVWVLTSAQPTEEQLSDWGAWAAGVNVKHSALDAATVRSAHSRGLSVAAWTVNDSATAAMLVAMGVDSILTNRVWRINEAVGCG